MSTHREQVKFKPPLSGVRFDASLRFDMEQLNGWKPPQIQALMRGIAEVLAATPDRQREREAL